MLRARSGYPAIYFSCGSRRFIFHLQSVYLFFTVEVRANSGSEEREKIMAKKKTAAATGDNVIAFRIDTLPPEHKATLRALTPGVLSAARTWGDWNVKIKDLAPRVIRLFIALQYYFTTIPGAKAFRFIDFVRLFDPQTPEHAEDYRTYRTYYTLRNMQTVYNAANRESAEGQTQGGPIRDKAVVLAARLMLAFQALPGVDGNKIVVDAINEVGLSKNVQKRFADRMASLKPMFLATVTGRNAHITLDVVPMTDAELKAAEGKTATNEPMRQKGKTIHVPAAIAEQAAALGVSLAHGIPQKQGRRKAS